MQPCSPEEQALKTTLDESFVRGRGGRGIRCRGRGRGRPFDKSVIECYNCHKLGHFRYECPDLEKRANYVETNEDEEFLLMSCVELDTDKDDDLLFEEALLMSQEELQQTKKEDVWFLDSGCSNHMTGNKEWFVELEEGYSRTVKKQRMVRWVRRRLLENSEAWEWYENESYWKRKSKDASRWFHSGLIMHTGMSGNRMFYVLATMAPKSSMCLQTNIVSEEEVHLWHCRFGHLNHRGLNTLSHKKMVTGLPSIKSSKHNICSSCLIGKQHREVRPHKGTWRAAQESGAMIGCLRTDRGGEFNSNEFREFCENHGIKRQLTTAFTPQQNGVAERKNRTIMNAVKTVLNERQVPKVFWPEAVKWCVHVQNRSPTTALENKTPEEEWSSLKPTVGYFGIFGCVAHWMIKAEDVCFGC
ncbi:retrovirus-related pol polyprotein from transposon TNT 1-94 [Tanacetum coccineum]